MNGAVSTRVTASSTNGRAGSMPAFYEGELFTINLKELTPTAEQTVLRSNKSINTIYMDEVDTPMLPAVINAIQGNEEAGPGFNPLWREIKFQFINGFTPHALTSEDAVLAAAAAHQITLTTTNEVYRCSVIGPVK